MNHFIQRTAMLPDGRQHRTMSDMTEQEMARTFEPDQLAILARGDTLVLDLPNGPSTFVDLQAFHAARAAKVAA